MEIKIEAREAKRAEEAAAAAAAEAAEAERRAAEGEEEIGSDKDKDIEMEENQGLEYKGESQEEDYDDELPIEDSDDEGGLVKFIANNGEDEKVCRIFRSFSMVLSFKHCLSVSPLSPQSFSFLLISYSFFFFTHN